MTRPGNRPRRSAAAAVEFALVAPFLLAMMLGIWEIGRAIQIKQALSTAAREGARLAAQGLTINETNAATLIQVDSGDPNVKQTIRNFLREAGYDVPWNDLTVTFTYLDGDTTKTQPHEASKGQRFRVEVTMPYTPFRWASLGFAPVELKAAAVWSSLVDDPFTLDTTLPTW